MEILQITMAIGLIITLAVVIAYSIHQVRTIYRIHQIEKGAKEATKYMKGYIEQK